MKSVYNLLLFSQNNPHLLQQRCKLVLLVPNTEINEEVDSKLQAIISLAQKNEIPLLYCLSKRQLGKSLQMTIKQTIVGIVDPNGIYDHFKKIISFIQHYSKL
jgi:ribosomal protein L7Ae-like RNA K-turn-binding protein